MEGQSSGGVKAKTQRIKAETMREEGRAEQGKKKQAMAGEPEKEGKGEEWSGRGNRPSRHAGYFFPQDTGTQHGGKTEEINEKGRTEGKRKERGNRKSGEWKINS